MSHTNSEQDESQTTLQHDPGRLEYTLFQGEQSIAKHLTKWLPPGATGETHATWLELFYDLIFVVAVSQLTLVLSEDLTFDGFGKYLFLFLPMFSAWIATISYSDRFVVNDRLHRLLIFTQMIAVAFMAASISGALEDRAAEFALSVAVIRILLVLMYLRVIVADTSGRQLARQVGGFYAFTSVIWFVSAFVPEPVNYFLWGSTLLVDLGAFLFPTFRQHVANIPQSLAHRQERFGLFVIIVMGESAAGVVTGLLDHAVWTRSLTMTVIFGMIIAYALWRTYFSLEAAEPPITQRESLKVDIWSLGHYPLVVAIGAYGVAIEHAVSDNPGEPLDHEVRWLLAGAVALSLLAIFLVRSQQTTIEQAAKAGWTVLFSAALLLIMAAFLTGISTELFVFVTALIIVVIPILATRGRSDKTPSVAKQAATK